MILMFDKRTVGATLGIGAAALLSSASTLADDPALRFHVRGIDADRGGVVRCALYAEEDNWLEDEPYDNDVVDVTDGQVTCMFANIPEGDYATAALHDEDGDSEMDMTLGVPEEGYCMSRNAQEEGIGEPDWEDAVFHYGGGDDREVADMSY
jgi:uncharacterized protein (DUF2141 family)